jgi:hypothetical protein
MYFYFLMLNNYSLLNKCIECWKLLTYFGLFEEYSISKEEIRKLLHVTIVTPPPPPNEVFRDYLKIIFRLHNSKLAH